MGVTDGSFLSLFFPIISLIILSWYTEHLSVQLSRFLVLIIIYVSRARIVNTNNISELALYSPDKPSSLPSRHQDSHTNPDVTSGDLSESWLSLLVTNWHHADIWHYPHLHLQAGVDTGGAPGALPLLATPGSFLRPEMKIIARIKMTQARFKCCHSDSQECIFKFSSACSPCRSIRLHIERLIRVMGSWQNPLGFNKDNGITQHETSSVETVGINVFICFLIVSNIPPTCQVKVSLVWASPVPPWLYFPASETVRLWQKYPFCCPPFSCK